MEDIIYSLNNITDYFLLKLDLNVCTWHEKRIWDCDLYTLNFFVCVVFVFTIVGYLFVWRSSVHRVVITTVLVWGWSAIMEVDISWVNYPIVVNARLYGFHLLHRSNCLFWSLVLFNLSCIPLGCYGLTCCWPSKWLHCWALHHWILIRRS